MNINQEILQELIKNNFQNSLNYLKNVFDDSLNEKKIEFLDSSFYDENHNFEFKGKLEAVHINNAYQNYFLFLEDKETIKYILKKGTDYLTEFCDNNQKPNNFDASKIFLESFLLNRDIFNLSDEAICYISPYVEIIQPSVNFKNVVFEIINKYIKEEKSFISESEEKCYIKCYMNKDSTSEWSEFEKLSKENKIIFKTCLTNKSSIFFIMKLFRIIYDNKYYLLNNFEYFHKYLSNHKISFDKSKLDQESLLSKLDNIIFTDYIIESNKIPDVIVSDSKKKQKIFTLADIKKLIKK
jgi:hypothetical protein